MSLLRLAKATTQKIELSEDGDYIEVVGDLSKRKFNELVSSMPQDVAESGLTIPQAIEFQKALFDTFVVGWSIPESVSQETYQELSKEAGDAIDSAVAKHFESLTPSQDQQSKSA